jgi:hypothetical protein
MKEAFRCHERAAHDEAKVATISREAVNCNAVLVRNLVNIEVG